MVFCSNNCKSYLDREQLKHSTSHWTWNPKGLVVSQAERNKYSGENWVQRTQWHWSTSSPGTVSTEHCKRKSTQTSPPHILNDISLPQSYLQTQVEPDYIWGLCHFIKMRNFVTWFDLTLSHESLDVYQVILEKNLLYSIYITRVWETVLEGSSPNSCLYQGKPYQLMEDEPQLYTGSCYWRRHQRLHACENSVVVFQLKT